MNLNTPAAVDCQPVETEIRPSDRLRLASVAPDAPRDERAATDEELIQRILVEDRAAAGEFFRRYRTHVTRVLMRIMGGDSEISDLVQETFLRALRGIGNLRSPDAMRSWLTRVATYTALDHLRRRRGRGWLEFVPPEQIESRLEPEESTVMPRVQAIMDVLSPEERVALTLRYMGGLEQKELADAMGCSVATAKRRVNKAKKRFESLAAHDDVLKLRLEAHHG